ncbi:MAG: hypothetical protein LQ345_004140 [Seirophora villosa]|nr:MAG: hypothetical protein LQ345_004140 [Seirophora villosa]
MPVADAQQQGWDAGGEIYGSETPSPLSPITPSDRLSPIEELDDNASLRSTWPHKADQGGTGADQDSRTPRTRPMPSDFELPNPAETSAASLSLEARSELLFSRRHLELIFADKELSKRFGTFLRTYRPDSVPILAYYLDTIKALRTLKYAEAVVKNLERIPGLEFTADAKGVAMTWVLEDKADRVLDIMTKNDLPAFIAYVYVSIVDVALVERVTGKADMEVNDVAVGLAETRQDQTIRWSSHRKVRFPHRYLSYHGWRCLSLDFIQGSKATVPANHPPSLMGVADVAAEFHRMTQYPSNRALGRNCRFLGGPKTDPYAIGRLKVSLEAEREHCEAMLN